MRLRKLPALHGERRRQDLDRAKAAVVGRVFDQVDRQAPIFARVHQVRDQRVKPGGSLRDVGAKLIGMVLNQVDLQSPAYYAYGAYQSYGYRRGEKAA